VQAAPVGLAPHKAIEVIDRAPLIASGATEWWRIVISAQALDPIPGNTKQRLQAEEEKE